MRSIHAQTRKSGIRLIGDLPWGSHFCHFFRTVKDQLEILVPYFRAGLENNEFCLWVTSDNLGVDEAAKAMKKAMPRFDGYMERGQIEIIPDVKWRGGRAKAGSVVIPILDRAVSGGFEGLRLSCGCLPENKRSKRLLLEDISRCNVTAAFGYPYDGLDAAGLMEVVKDHWFALVRNAGRWDVIESSEARTVKDALKRSEEKLRFLFSNMSEGFAYHRMIMDPKGKPLNYVFLEVNGAFEKLTGLKGRNIIGRRVTVVLPGIEKDPAGWIGKYGEVAMSGKPAQFESYSEQLGKWYSVSAFCPHKGFFAVTFSDITERKLAEEELRRNRDDLEAANKELESFSYSVSHDLRAPLRAIDGFSRIVLEDYAGKLDEEGRRLLNIVRKNTQEMGELIEDLLSFSRIGRQKITPVEIDMRKLAEKIYEDIMTALPGRAITFVVKDPPNVFADRMLVRQMLVNLLSNAVKFTQPREAAHIEFGGGIEGREAIYYVRDNGVGFDMNYANKLFGVFQRLHSADEFEGTGVGLAIVQRIALMHGGRVWAEGKINEGAVFYFALPCSNNGNRGEDREHKK